YHWPFWLLFLTHCSFYYQDIEVKRAQEAIRAGDYKKAVFHYKRVIKKSPEKPIALTAANEAAKISILNVKDFFSAINLLEFIVLYSKNEMERINAQEKIAYIYFERLNDYENAIKEYSKLIALTAQKAQRIGYQFNVAKSFYYLNKFTQSVFELDSILEEKLTEEQNFTIRLFKANVLITKKDFEKAINEYEFLLEKFPEKAAQEKLALIVAVAYEDMNEFEKAIETLEKLKPKAEDPQFIDIKIKRLQERISNQPGKKRKS
ncbi:MAG: tetratricopeptide repeat protein, partial [Bdellovibrionales bacterium]|nr:tetratricopeptide repeat protein [Bdellovibrionales bacterium]